MNIERIDLSVDAMNYLASMQTTAPLAAEEALSMSGSVIQKVAETHMKVMRHRYIKYLNKKTKYKERFFFLEIYLHIHLAFLN